MKSNKIIENKKDYINQKMSKNETRQKIKKILKYMLSTALCEKPSLYIVYLVIFLSTLLQKTVLVLLPKLLIDELIQAVNGAATKVHIKNIVFYAVLTCFIEFVANLFIGLANQYKGVLEEWFNEHFQLLLADKSMKMDFEQTEDPQTLDCQARAKDGIGWYSGGIVGILDYFFGIVTNIAVLLGVGTIIFLSCPLLLPVQIFFLVLISYFNAQNNLVEIDAYGHLAKQNRIFGYYLFQLSDFTYGKEIRLYNSAKMMNQRASNATDRITGVWKGLSKKQCKYLWCMDISNAIRDGISYFYIGFLAVKRVITIGDFTMCITSATELYQCMTNLVNNYQEIVKRSTYAYHFIEFLGCPETLMWGTKKAEGKEHEIVFENVSFRYPRSKQYILKNINLTIHPGEHLSIVGMNGAGKTTFIKLLCRLYDVTDGVIKLDGRNICDYSEEEYQKLFATVFQDFKLFAFSLKENISFDLDTPSEKILAMLSLTGLDKDIKKLSNGIDTILNKSFDENGTELSGGQQQRTAISRALYRNAPIVILDEPTAALDPIAEYDIYRQFNNLVGNKTAIYISHRLSSCKFCDHIAVFAENTIKEYGTHAELVNKENGIYAKMFATQAQYYINLAQ